MLKKNKQNNLEIQLFDLFRDYDDIIKSDNFISYEKLISTSLLKANTSFKNSKIAYLDQKIAEALAKKHEIIFRNFIISYQLNTRFSLTLLLPTITTTLSSNTRTLNLSASQDIEVNGYLQILNNTIKELLNNRMCIEIFPEIVIFIDNSSNTLKLLFGKTHLATIGTN